jgi:hypothetical protein
MSDWGYLGEDYVNPAVEIDLNPLEAGEGVSIGRLGAIRKKKLPATSPIAIAAKIAQAKKRPLTSGEKKQIAMITRGKVTSDVQSMKQQVPVVAKVTTPDGQVLGVRVGDTLKMSKSQALINPVAAAKVLAQPIIEKQIAQTKAQAIQAAKKLKLASNAELAKVKSELNAGIKAGTVSPSQAKSILQNKAREIKGKYKASMQTIRDESNKKIGDKKQVRARIHAQLINKRDVAIDKKRQSLEDEIRKVSTSSMPEPGKSATIAALKKRLATVDMAKQETVKRKQVATVVQMANKGVLPKAEAQKLAKNIKKKADALEKKRKAGVSGTVKLQKAQGRLYVLGKWIQAYTSAIQYAQQMGVNSVVIPMEAMKNRVGTVNTPAKVVKSRVKKPTAIKTANGLSYIGMATTPSPTINEVRMPLQTAKANLEKFKMEYNVIEKQIAAKAGSKELPIPKIQPVTQTGQPVSPEMLTAQESFLRSQIASGKVNAIVGAQAIKQLQTVSKLMQHAHKPILQPTTKQRPSMIIQVFISPQAMNGIRTGERMVTTKAGTGKTKVKVPKTTIPSAIPHATAKTVGTVAKKVSMKPTRPPSVIPSRPATQATPASRMVGGAIKPAHTKPPAVSLSRPGAIQMGYRKMPKGIRGRTISPFKKVSLTEILNQATIPWPKKR